MNKDSRNASEELDELGWGELLKGTVVLLLITMGSTYSFVKSKTIFPFATYPMFSRLHSDDLQFSRMYGLPEDASAQDQAAEVDISEQKFWGLQMHIGRKVGAVSGLVAREDTTPEDIEIAMGFLRDLYNKRRDAGLHDGPPIKRLRMYQQSWKVRTDLSTLKQPLQRELVAESSMLDSP